jgi:hypothetical protein
VELQFSERIATTQGLACLNTGELRAVFAAQAEKENMAELATFRL